MQFSDSKNVIHDIWCMLSPYPRTRIKFRVLGIGCLKPRRRMPKTQTSPHVRPSAKNILKKNLCRVPDGGHSAKTNASGRHDPSGHICRGPICRGLGPRQRFILPRAVCLPRAKPSAKACLPRAYLCRGLLGLALGKDPLCRVPEI